MGASPVVVLSIIAIYVTFYAVYQGSQPNTYGLDSAPDLQEPSSGVFDVIASVLHTVWTVITTIVGALVFNVDGAPFYIQVPVAIMIVSSLIWSVATLIRGN